MYHKMKYFKLTNVQWFKQKCMWFEIMDYGGFKNRQAEGYSSRSGDKMIVWLLWS
jgi:hypothetical protein